MCICVHVDRRFLLTLRAYESLPIIFALLIMWQPSTLCHKGILLRIKALRSSIGEFNVHIPFMATGVISCHKMGLEGNEQIMERAPAPVNVLSLPLGN